MRGVRWVAASVLALHAGAARVEETAVRSETMGINVPVSVVLPERYATATQERFAVVYMLHGANRDHKSYAGKLTGRLVDAYGVIAVCPDGARTSWWIDAPAKPSSRYETFVSFELIAAVDRRYRTRPDRAHRAIMGGSMGGHGACWNGFRHTDVFGAVGSVFGGHELRPHAGKWGLNAILGDAKTSPDVWDGHSVVSIAPALKNGDIELMMVVGTEDFFLKHNRKLHDILSRNGVGHAYVEVCGPDSARSRHTRDFFDMVEPLVFRFLTGYFRTGKGIIAETDEIGGN